MTASRRLTCFALLALLMAACRETKLEHFKFYELTPLPAGRRVELKGQLDGGSFKLAELVEITHFGNPVNKARTDLTPTPGDESPPEPPGEEEPPTPTPFPPLENPKHHLTWYRIQEKSAPRVAVVTDQFGMKDVIIGDAVAVLMPAHKHENGGEPPPEKLNHFKCYDILQYQDAVAGETAGPEPVALQDQFDRPNVDLNVAERLRFLCVPVEKRRSDRSYKRGKNRGRYDHLLVYDLRNRRSYDERKTVTDQNFENTLAGFRSHFLAVPALKRPVVPGNALPPPRTPTPTPRPTRTP